MNVPAGPSGAAIAAPPRRRRLLLLVFLVCAAPVIASYLAYYRFPPAGRTNYGALVEPQRPLATLALRGPDGGPLDLSSWRGHWVMLQVDAAACAADCRRKLWDMRQLRLTTGKDRDRVLRAWLVTDAAPIDADLQREFEGTDIRRADAATVAATIDSAAPAGASGSASRFIWLVDPGGNLMLRWPADGDPNRMKRDLLRLLAASSIG
ncbi:MAG TPA: cytochrome C oxidase subunit I [Burkholderiaceae bacterium]|nr:cytochrome C oxidase subunit I [Burkholderiaceae bacterium]